MESERTLRFAIAPALLLAWAAVGKLFAGEGGDIEELLREADSVGKAIMVVATTGAVLAVAGYVMSLVTVFFFHLLELFCIRIEVPLRARTIERMRNRLIEEAVRQTEVPIRGFSRLAVVVTYQSRFWDKQATIWAERRWMNVGICANGILAIVGAIVLGHYVFEIPFTEWWVALSVGLAAMFLIHIIVTVNELARMHFVASLVDLPESEKRLRR